VSTVLVDGTDLATATRFEEDRDGYYAIPQLRGERPVFPGVDGDTDIEQDYATLVFPQHLVLHNASVAEANDEFRTLKKLCKPGQTVTLTKRTTFTGGDEDVTATAKLRDIQRSRINPVTARCVIEWDILDGVWYGATDTRSLSNGLNSVLGVLGDVRTKRMTITLTGGTTPTLTNFTLGYALTYSGSMSSPVTIDVLAGTATQSSTDVSQYLSWTKAVPFALRPGTNSIGLTSSGSGSITYYPAF
jgi:hypothetical protein